MLIDLGMVMLYVVECFDGCDVLVLECNYDIDMFADGLYLLVFKVCVGGVFGYFVNEVVVGLLW